MARKPGATPQIGALIICDDIRKEISNKDILIGVYGSEIMVPEFPATILLSFWMEIIPTKVGELSLRLHISLNEKILARIEGSEGALKIEVSWDGGKTWSEIKTKSVTRGDVRNILAASPSS